MDQTLADAMLGEVTRPRGLWGLALVGLLAGGCASIGSSVLPSPEPARLETPAVDQQVVQAAVPAQTPTPGAPEHSTVGFVTAAVDTPPPQPASAPSAESVPRPEVLDPPDSRPLATPTGSQLVPIDLGTALHLAAGRNPRVAFAQARVREAYSDWRLARVMWLPSLRAGMNYNKHEGAIQDVAGTFIDTSRGSVYTGLGAQAVGAGSPAIPGVLMNFHLRDAIFNPRIAERTWAAQRRASQAATNDTLLEASLAYLDLLEAAQLRAVAEETAENARRLAELTATYARVGQGLEADADRAAAESALRQIEAQRAVERLRVASARLTRTLSQDQNLSLVPEEPVLAPIEMVNLDPGLPGLIALGLSQRPELAEHQLLVGAAVERMRREQAAPLIPSVLLGASYGGNGGGLGSDFRGFGDRFDVDIAAYWEIRQLGWGEQASRSLAQARVQQANHQRVAMLDQVAAEITEAHAQVEIRQGQIELAAAGLRAAEQSLDRNLERIRQAQGLPIETLQAIQALDQARRLYVGTIADYNRAQFQLHRALGWPIIEPGSA